MADEAFDQYAVGWEALSSADADPADDASWTAVYSVQADRATAEQMTHILREVHRLNPTIRDVNLFGRPPVPGWEAMVLGPRPIPPVPVIPEPEPEDPAEPEPEPEPAPAEP